MWGSLEMPNDKDAAPDGTGASSTMAENLERRARTSRLIGVFVLALAGLAGAAAAVATIVLWTQVAGDPAMLPIELPELTPTTLAASGGIMLILAATLGALSMKMTDRASDLAVRSSFLRLGAATAQGESGIRRAA